MADVLVLVKECDVCRAALRVEIVEDRTVAFDFHSGQEHECFDVPANAELLVMDTDAGCNC